MILVRIERLKQRGIKPTLKRLVFLEQALSDRDKQMINLTEMNYSEEADAATVSLIRDHQIQMSREYLELKQEVQDLKSQLHQRQRPEPVRDQVQQQQDQNQDQNQNPEQQTQQQQTPHQENSETWRLI
jgi:hypothetical protein